MIACDAALPTTAHTHTHLCPRRASVELVGRSAVAFLVHHTKNVRCCLGVVSCLVLKHSPRPPLRFVFDPRVLGTTLRAERRLRRPCSPRFLYSYQVVLDVVIGCGCYRTEDPSQLEGRAKAAGGFDSCGSFRQERRMQLHFF
jgi:hypothetical protein